LPNWNTSAPAPPVSVSPPWTDATRVSAPEPPVVGEVVGDVGVVGVVD
jgi:hypothetical protein